jgi:hypothetical protein
VLTALTLLLLLVAARGGAWVEDARTKVYVQLGKYTNFATFFCSLGLQTLDDHVFRKVANSQEAFFLKLYTNGQSFDRKILKF